MLLTLIKVQVMVCVLPSMWNEMKMIMFKGWTISPTAKSVVAKQASEMLDFVRRGRFVFTATITRTFNIIARGKVKVWKATFIAYAEYTPEEIFARFMGRLNSERQKNVASGMLFLYGLVFSEGNQPYLSFKCDLSCMERKEDLLLSLLLFAVLFRTSVLSVWMPRRKADMPTRSG